jgi:hypothetical protein
MNESHCKYFDLPEHLSSSTVFSGDRVTQSLVLCVMEEEFEDTKGVIRILKSKDRHGQKKKNKRTNNDLQNITHKTKD